MKAWWTIIFLALSAAAASGDVVHLRDGSTLEGQVRRTADGYQITTLDGRTAQVATGDVKSIELKRAGTESPDQQYDALARFLAGTSDPKQAVQRCKTFIAQNSGTPAAAKAAHDLTLWHARLDQHMIRIGANWLTPEQVAQQSAQAHQAVQAIAPLVATENTAAASAALAKVLAVAPKDPGLLYLKGLVLIQQEQLVPARQAFEQVEKLLPDHAATHNNLAIILWKTHALIPALAEYDKAMLAAHANRAILDNVAEALHLLPENLEKNAVAVRVLQHFQEQDAELQDKMRGRGLRRAGARWITQEEYAARVEAEKVAAEKKETFPTDLLALQYRLIEIDRTIEEDMNILNAMRQQSTWVVYGGVVQYPLPDRYYHLESEVSKLKAERLMKQRQLAQLPKAVRESLQRTVTNDYTGKQNLIGVSGTPGLPPTTQPTTQPS